MDSTNGTIKKTENNHTTSTTNCSDLSSASIQQHEIAKTFDADVVVVGAGISGLTAALSAAQSGAKTIEIEKGPSFNFRGIHNAAINSKLQQKANIKIDKEQLIYTIMETAAYRGNQRIVNTWADNCDSVMNWLLDMAEKENIDVALDSTTKSWYFPNYPVVHVFDASGFTWQGSLARMLFNNGQKHGVDVHFNTAAVKLLRKKNGRVAGVIAKNQKGDALQFNAGKAVVLCSGDYGNNLEMVEQYCWHNISKLPNLYHTMTEMCYKRQNLPGTYNTKPNTGDGHRMAMEIGAAIDDPPHCVMLFDYTTWSKGKLFDLARQPWLYVNIKGERFMNEDLPWGYECSQIMQQPEYIAWSIWDAKWEKEVPIMSSQCCKNMGAPTYLWNPKWLDEAIEEGNVLTANTITELGEKMKVPFDTFKATVKRYNQMARDKKDLDFGKHPDRLTTLERPLYYAAQITAVYLVTLGGLKINSELQVLDDKGKIIPGLYAAGNVSGSFFGSQYPTTIAGLSHSRAWTFGRLAGLAAAAEKV